MNVDLIDEIEKMAPVKHRSDRKSYYYDELEKKCDSPKAYRAILITILQCQRLIKNSKAPRNIIASEKRRTRKEYMTYINEKKRILRTASVADIIEGFKPEPSEFTRYHMGIIRGSFKALVDEHGKMVISHKREAPKGGRPKKVYMQRVLLMLNCRFLKYSIKSRYAIISEIFYYFFGFGQRKGSMYENDTVKDLINRHKKDKTLVARVEHTPRLPRLSKRFPRKDDISI